MSSSGCGSAGSSNNEAKRGPLSLGELGGRDCIPSEGLAGHRAPTLRRRSGGNASSPPSDGDGNSPLIGPARLPGKSARSGPPSQHDQSGLLPVPREPQLAM